MASLSERRQTVGRLREIAQVATRHGFGFVFERRALRRAAVIDDQNLPALGRHLRETLDELGPTFVKFGQLLSTRPDIVPAEIIAELRQLQDDVRPFPYAEVERMIEEDLHAPIEKLYTAFDPVPVAAASIGQVHLAELPSRRLVAIAEPAAPVLPVGLKRRQRRTDHDQGREAKIMTTGEGDLHGLVRNATGWHLPCTHDVGSISLREGSLK